jgi:hypothetical protein
VVPAYRTVHLIPASDSFTSTIKQRRHSFAKSLPQTEKGVIAAFSR